jgi:hypothetical protein
VLPISTTTDLIATVAELLQRINGQEARAQTAEAERKAMGAALQPAEDERKSMKVEIEDLQQRLIAKRTWSVVRKTQDLINDAVKYFRKLPPHVIVPHMRKTTTYSSDMDAMNHPASPKELKSAQLYIDSLIPVVEVRDFIALGVEDAIAFVARDRGKSG